MMGNPHIQVLRDGPVADHEQRIADEQRDATDAWCRKWHQDHVAALRAVRYPWDKATPLAFLLAQGPHIVALVGSSRPGIIEDSAAAASLHLDDEDLRRLSVGQPTTDAALPPRGCP
jgi:aryl-alcohol dehydrogenase-like predicted oxidoreductase